MSPYQRVQKALVNYYRSHQHWPESYADLDSFGVLEFSVIQSISWSVSENETLDVRMFITAGKGAFKVERPEKTHITTMFCDACR